MRKLIILISLIISPFIFGQKDYRDSIQKARQNHQLQFLFEVLDSSEAAHFKGICYFEVDTNFIIEASFKREKGKKFQMPMSKERIVYYRKYGTLTFTKNDTTCVLTVYENLSLKGKKEYKDYLFLPFKDKTTGSTTYGGGKYLDVYKSTNAIWKLDFNASYHPYCAYSERYSCPLVPSENQISLEIKAGECYEGY
jgi:uncharacterized protein (DUF1684 family)